MGKKDLIKFGVVGGLVSSLCCISPIVLMLIGIGFSPIIIAFTKMKPLFFILGLSIISAGILYHILGKRKCSYKIDKRKVVTDVLLTLSVFLVSYIVLTEFLPLNFFEKEGESEGECRAIVKSYSLTCTGCAYSFKKYLENLSGVSEVLVYPYKGEAIVIYSRSLPVGKLKSEIQSFFENYGPYSLEFGRECY